jgi:hypothetical protein
VIWPKQRRKTLPALSLEAVAAGVMNGRPGSLADSWIAWKRSNQFCRAFRPARRFWPLRQSAGRCRLQRRGNAATGTQRPGSRRRGRGHLSLQGVRGRPYPNVAAGPTLPARQTCALPAVGAPFYQVGELTRVRLAASCSRRCQARRQNLLVTAIGGSCRRDYLIPRPALPASRQFVLPAPRPKDLGALHTLNLKEQSHHANNERRD